MEKLTWDKMPPALIDEAEELLRLAFGNDDLNFLLEQGTNKGLTNDECLSKSNVPQMTWNELSAVGLIAYLNNVLFHPLGYAISRDPESGWSEVVLFEKEPWEYADGILLEEMEKAGAAGILIEGWNIPFGDC